MDSVCIGMSEFTTWPWTFEKDVAAYRRHGLGAIEITEFKLDQARLGKQLSTIASSGLRVASVQALIHGIFPTRWQPEPTDPQARIERIKRSIDAIAPHVPPRTPFVIISGAVPYGDCEHARATVIDGLRGLARFAAERSMRLAFEPLNPAVMNVDTAVWTVRDALSIVDAVGEPNCGICIDTWNVWENPDLESTIVTAGERIFLVQIADYRRPRALYDRLIPGEGEIPLASIVAALRRARYSGPYVIELLSSEALADSLWKRNLDEVIRASMQSLEQIFGKVAA